MINAQLTQHYLFGKAENGFGGLVEDDHRALRVITNDAIDGTLDKVFLELVSLS